jgi:enoyl-CoA hydratase/carnithine racemase
MGSSKQDRPTLMQQRERLRAGPEMTDAWERIEAVTIAAIDGPCLGGGAALALACDWRIVGERATLRLPEVPLGMNMSWHSLPRLAALVGPARAKRITILGEAVDAPTMLAWGLAEAVAPAGQAEAEARRWAERVAALPPLPVRMSKEALNAAVAAQHQALAFADRDQYLLTAQSEDLREGVAAFFEKRKPRFRGA